MPVYMVVPNCALQKMPFVGWILLALLLHWLLLSLLWVEKKSQTAASQKIVRYPLRVVIQPGLRVAQPQTPLDTKHILPLPAEGDSEKITASHKQRMDNSGKKRETISGQVVARPKPRVSIEKLKQAVRDYQLPLHNDRKDFSPILPEGLTEEAFSANEVARMNYHVQQHQNRGGAKVIRTQPFGGKERCYLWHRTAVEIEREDWNPGMATLYGATVEEIACY